MGALNFQKQFLPAVENGIDMIKSRPYRHPGITPKTQTIRAERKDNRVPLVGEHLYLYNGMRTKHCLKLADVVCDRVAEVRVDEFSLEIDGVRYGWRTQGADQMAIRDGFENSTEMWRWFEKAHRLEFRGHLMTWSALWVES